MNRDQSHSTGEEEVRAGPLHRRLAQEIKRGITSGIHPVGTILIRQVSTDGPSLRLTFGGWTRISRP